MNIHEVAERTGISAYTIRFYEKSGVLPEIHRSEAGIRQFTEADITFLEFVADLRRTDMSLQDIVEFTQDGCFTERIVAKCMAPEPVRRRVDILHRHRQHLLEQRCRIDMLTDAVNQKLKVYEDYLAEQSTKQTGDPL